MVLVLIMSIVQSANLKASLITFKQRLTFNSTEELALSDDPVLVLDDGFAHRLYLVSDW